MLLKETLEPPQRSMELSQGILEPPQWSLQPSQTLFKDPWNHLEASKNIHKDPYNHLKSFYKDRSNLLPEPCQWYTMTGGLLNASWHPLTYHSCCLPVCDGYFWLLCEDIRQFLYVCEFQMSCVCEICTVHCMILIDGENFKVRKVPEKRKQHQNQVPNMTTVLKRVSL